MRKRPRSSALKQTRNPKVLCRVSGGSPLRSEERHTRGLRNQEPPRRTRISPSDCPVGSVRSPALYGPNQSAHHSQTLP
jgi:hypothetical protein